MKAFSGELNFHNRVTGNGETDTDSMLAGNNLVTEKISGKIEFFKLSAINKDAGCRVHKVKNNYNAT